MSSLSNIVNYFKSCYQVDFKAIHIPNFFGKKVAHQLILNSAELISGKLMQYPVDSKWGAEVEEMLALHSQEKTLYCCSFFIAGKMMIIGKSQKIFAPLYIHPVSLLVEHEVYYLTFDPTNIVINPAFPEFINTQYQDINLTYDELEAALPKGSLRFEEIFKIQKVLKKLIPALDTKGLDNYPQLYAKDQIRSAYRKANNNPPSPLIPGIGIGLIQKAIGSKGVLNELGKMATQDDYADVISDLFFPNSSKTIAAQSKKILTPVTLSENQLEIFKSYESNRLSLVIGPPGTGKSFTIAALAVDLISQGKSVLIASKNNQGGAVIAQKIESDFGLKGVVIKTAGKSYRTLLQKRLNNIFHGLEIQKVKKSTLLELEQEINELDKSIVALKNAVLKRETEELDRGTFFYNYQNSFFQRIRKSYIKFIENSRQPLWHLMASLEKSSNQLNKKIKIFIRRRFDFYLYETLRRERSQIQTLLNALDTDIGNITQQYFDKIDFNIILHALPAWIVNASNVHSVLPFQKELFDVVIIDEATQCDIASSLPLLQRGRKAVIVGDPKQLRHLSFLSKNQQDQFAQKHGIVGGTGVQLNYRKNSLLDLASIAIPSQDQVHFLDEHYRSMPEIIDFSNRHFYANRLKVMTATPVTLKEKSVFPHPVSGQRNSKGSNEQEAEAIIKMVLSIATQEAKLHKRLCQSIGILSPFRVQVNYIKSQIRKAINVTQFRRHQILIGTPHQFQGEERDVMLLSFVVDNKTHPSTFTYLNKPDVFNVSITRARSLQHVFFSISPEKLNPDSLFSQFLQHTALNSTKDTELSSYQKHDEFLEEIADLLKKWKADQIYKAYPIAGIEIDLVVIHRGSTYCIDLIGFPGEYEKIFPIEHWKMLTRIGVKTFSLPYSSWFLNRDKCMKALKRFIFSRKGKQKNS